MASQKWSFKITPIRILLFISVVLTAFAVLFRLATGLGVSTNLNDSWPWGLWIGFDLTGIALAGAGYSICLLSHVLHIKKFGVFARRGLLISLLGYVYALMTLIIEVGRWDNAWRPLVSWGHHSPLFEVFVAITIYMMIQTLEFSEILTEKVFKSWHKYVKKILPVVFIIGALIPFGHQASLGAVYLIMPTKLHPIWYSSLLPIFFLITSFYVGPALVVLDTIWSSKVYKHDVDTGVMRSIVKISGVLMLIYFAIKVFDLIRLNNISYVFAGGLESNMFILEMTLGVLVPAIICFTSWSKTKAGLTTFSVLTILGVVISRLNVVFTGMYKALGPSYVPNWVEWTISLGLIAVVALMYIFIVENFAIFGHGEKGKQQYDLKAKEQNGVSLAAK